MKILHFFAGNLIDSFEFTDEEKVEWMCNRLDDPCNDIDEFILENNEPVLFWRRNGKIRGNIFGHPECDISEKVIANREENCKVKKGMLI